MNQVKVWVKTNQLDKIGSGQSPDKYWTSAPLQESNVIEMNISIEDFSRWVNSAKKENLRSENFGKKQLLND